MFLYVQYLHTELERLPCQRVVEIQKHRFVSHLGDTGVHDVPLIVAALKHGVHLLCLYRHLALAHFLKGLFGSLPVSVLRVDADLHGVTDRLAFQGLLQGRDDLLGTLNRR